MVILVRVFTKKIDHFQENIVVSLEKIGKFVFWEKVLIPKSLKETLLGF